jgi:hypothetical protein
MEVFLVGEPVAQRDHNVAFDTLRPLRHGLGKLAFADAIGPVCEIPHGQRPHTRQLLNHERAGLA